MANFDHRTNRFIFLGLFLAAAGDIVPEGFYTYATNIRSYQQGVITSRKGMSAIGGASGAGAIHSIKRLNNDLSSASQAFARFRGAGTTLESDNSAHNAFTQRSTGFSGNPLTMIPFRPSESPEPFLYVGDSTKIIKAKVDGTTQNWGIAPPSSPPTATLASPLSTTIEEGRSTAGWATGGIASGVTHSAIPAGFVNEILYDSGTTGWASINLDNFSGSIVEQRFITLINLVPQTERILIQQVLKAIKTTTIASITYDSGSTGLCTIVPTAQARKRYIKDAMIQLNTGGGTQENVRIQSISVGPDDQLSFRCSTTNNHAAGETLTGLASVRVNTSFTHTGGGGATGSAWNVDSFTITNSSAGGVGYITKSSTLDLSQINGRPVRDTDMMSVVVNFLNPETTDEIQVQLDCSDGSFSLDYYYKSIRPSDFSAAISGSSPSLEQRQRGIQNNIIDSTSLPFTEMEQREKERLLQKIQRLTQEGLKPQKVQNLRLRVAEIQAELDNLTADPRQSQTSAGTTQSALIQFPISELLRVGSDFSKGLKDIAALRIWIKSAAGTCQVNFSSWTIHGTYGPQVGEVGTPYIYRYQYRSKGTGVRSYPSPAMRSGLLAKNQRVTLTATASSDGQVDAYDWYRFGGTLNEWIYIGTSTSTSFNDDFPDASILGNPVLDFRTLQPFVIQDIPRSGTCNVSGTTITRVSGDSFNVQWVEGTQIIIDGTPATLYGSPSTTSKLFITESMGVKASVSFIIPSPEIAAQPLPIIFGPFLFGEAGSVMFGLGDSQNAGTLYWTNPDDPDSMADTNSVEVTSPSEPLMTGGLLDGRAFIFTNKKMYWVYPRQVEEGITFYAQESGCERGIIGRWAFCIGEGMIYFASEDGIYATSGGEPKRITDRIYQVFPHDGQAGSSTNGVIAPDYTHPETFQLSYGDSYLFFDYLGLDSAYHTLVADLKVPEPAWSNDEYSPTVRIHYFEEGKGVHNLLLGASDGRIYSNSGSGDGASSTTNISCQLRSGAEDFGSPRAKKVLGDSVVDYDPQGISISAQLGIDNYSTLPTPTGLLSTSGRRQFTVDIGNGAGVYGKNIALDLTWSSSSASPSLYLWEPYYILKPEDTEKRATDADNLGTEHAKWIQGFRIRCNTYNVSKSFKVQADTGTNGVFTDIQTFSITSNGESVQAFSFDVPFIAHLVRIIGNDSNDWSLINYEFEFDIEPELVEEWQTQPTSHGLRGWQFCRQFYVPHKSTMDWTFSVIIDNVTYNYPIPNSGGIKKKDYVPAQAVKGKVYQYKAISPAPGVRIYQKDLEVHIKEWGSSGGFQILKPLGDIDNTRGAVI